MPFAIAAATGLTPMEESKSPDTEHYRPIPAERSDFPSRRTITGKVIDEAGRPVVAATVRAKCHGATATQLAREVKTGDDGGFSFSALEPDGWWMFEVIDERFAPSNGFGTSLGVPASPRDLPLTLTAYRPRSFTGLVVDESGNPVAHANVTLIREVLPDGSFPQPNSSADLQTTRTDAAGKFRMDGLRAGQAAFFLEKRGFAKTMSANLDVDGGETRLTIDDGFQIKGRVVADGKPLADVTVKASTINLSHRNMGEFEQQTDRDGRFSFEHVADLTKNEYLDGRLATVFVDDAKWSSKYIEVWKNADGTIPPLEIAAQAGNVDPAQRGSEIAGFKHDAARARLFGQPTGTAQLRVSVPLAGDGPPDSVDVQVQQISDSTGAWRHSPCQRGNSASFSSLPAGKYVVTGTAYQNPHLIKTDVELADGQTVEITLRPGPCRVTGSIRDAEGPIKPITVRMDKVAPYEAPLTAFATVTDSGEYEFVGLSQGLFDLMISADTSVTTHDRVEVRGPQTRRDIVLPSGRIEGRLVDVNLPTRPGLGRAVLLARRDNPLDGSLAVTVADDQTFLVKHAPPGTYIFFATHENRPVYASVTLKPGDERVIVELNSHAPAGWIAGRVANLPDSAKHKHNPLTVSAIWMDVEGIDLSRWTTGVIHARNSEYEIPDLPPGKYVVLASDFAQRQLPPIWLGEVEVRQGRARVLDGACSSGRKVVFRLRSESSPDEPASIKIRLPNSPVFLPAEIWNWRQQIPDGRRAGFEWLLVPGSYELEIAIGPRAPVVRAFIVEPGDAAQEISIALP